MNAGELRDYYGLLGVSRTSTIGEIHKAYWHNASLSHPDRGGSHEEMVRLVEAWKILSDPNKRSRYDQLLKNQHDGWQSKKFNDDVQEARKRARGDAANSWAEFEEVYQKAFYTFNQDFYGVDIDKKAAGPYSPLMGSKNKGEQNESLNSRPEVSVLLTAKGSVFAYLVKTVILVAAIVASFLIYRNYSGVGRYVPLEQQDASHVLMLDTTNGAVYSVEKQSGTISSQWKESVQPFQREKK